jgi:hypothetical protein
MILIIKNALILNTKNCVIKVFFKNPSKDFIFLIVAILALSCDQV